MKKLSAYLFCAAFSLFLTASNLTAQRLPVNLGSVGSNNFAILTKTGITDTGAHASAITGNIGSSPITAAAMNGVFCSEITGTIYGVDAAYVGSGAVTCFAGNPPAANKTLVDNAVLDMVTAYGDAKGRTIPDFTELFAGNISGKTLVPGLYKWGTNVITDATGFTLSGGPNAVWIFQIAGDLTLASAAKVTLSGGAQASNIFWQVEGPTGATLGTTSKLYGTILSAKQVIMQTGATLIGRALAQTQVTLDAAPVTSPGPLVGGVPVVVPPTVTSTVPGNLATGVPISSQLTATFSEPMNPSTITTATFTVTGPGGTPVTGAVSYTGTTATFTPASNLASAASFTATITTGAKDPAGIALASNYVWTFVTAGGGGGGDTTPPTVSSTTPANLATGVPIGSKLTATFSEAMDPLTINTATFGLTGPGGTVTGTVSYAGTTATFTPASNLTPNTTYTSTITTAAKDLAGNALASNFVWNFTTGSTTDTTPPTVSSTNPTSGASGVAIGANITATFSKAMDPLTINTATFTVTGPGTNPVTGTVSYAGTTATFTPASNLPINTTLTATITTGAKDLAGNALATNFVWNFTTGTTGTQAPINFGSAASFAVLAGSAVTNVGPTNVNGDLGVSPGTAVTGFPPGTVAGTIHAGDAAAAQAQIDLTAAYNDAAGRSVGPVVVAGDIGGQTLTPGLYKSASSLDISAGDLTLDAKGDPNAVWIFQVASTFTTAAGRNIILTGGAKASNVIWQVGSSATLGANSAFRGNILANQSITVGSGASLEGRLLAHVGAVSFLGPITVTVPVPAINQGGTVNVASYTPTVAAGSIAAVFGSNLAFGQGFAGTIPLPTTLAGSSFQIGGRGAPLFYASPSQVNLQIPWELAGQTQASVTATVGAVGSNQQTVNIVPFAPGIFTLNQAGTGQGAVLINGTAQLAAPQSIPGSRPAHPGESISIYCTGLGAVSNQPATGGAAAQADPLSVTSTTPTVTIGGIVAQASFSGLAPGTVGLYQVNVQVPLGTPAGDAVPMTLTIGGATSNTVTVAVAAQ